MIEFSHEEVVVLHPQRELLHVCNRNTQVMWKPTVRVFNTKEGAVFLSFRRALGSGTSSLTDVIDGPVVTAEQKERPRGVVAGYGDDILNLMWRDCHQMSDTTIYFLLHFLKILNKKHQYSLLSGA